MMDASARALPQGPPYRVYHPRVRGGMWFRAEKGRMLSEAEYTADMHAGGSYTADANFYIPIPHDYRILVHAVDWALYISAAATWVCTLGVLTFDNAAGATIASRSTAGLTGAKWYGFTDAVEVEIDGTLGDSGSNPKGFYLAIDEQTGTSGLYPLATARYRLIAP